MQWRIGLRQAGGEFGDLRDPARKPPHVKPCLREATRFSSCIRTHLSSPIPSMTSVRYAKHTRLNLNASQNNSRDPERLASCLLHLRKLPLNSMYHVDALQKRFYQQARDPSRILRGCFGHLLDSSYEPVECCGAPSGFLLR